MAAKIIEKLLEAIKLDDDFDDDEYDEFDDEDIDDEEYVKKESKEKKYRKNTEEPEDAAVPDKPFLSKSRSSNVVPMRNGGRGMEVCLIKPTSVEDGREICDTLLSGRAVVINLEGIHTEVAQRIIDFTSGACYSMNGNLQKISNYIFIVTPATINLSGDFTEMLSGSGFDISSLNLNL